MCPELSAGRYCSPFNPAGFFEARHDKFFDAYVACLQLKLSLIRIQEALAMLTVLDNHKLDGVNLLGCSHYSHWHYREHRFDSVPNDVTGRAGMLEIDALERLICCERNA